MLWMLQNILPYLAAALGVILSIGWLRRDAVSDRDKDANLRRARDTLLAQQMREEIENDLETESDLVARAKRAGVVRPPTD
jgi:hypothetical protein